ncbi:MAG: prolipoprotein diacylglyceryl transferase, partial [Limosilactobacillus sp.]|nr:prolipoprotein diacylglyceryl transferase [Limosilactobacillus sp.]
MLAQLNPIAFYLLGWPVRWYGIIIATGVLVALWLAVKEGQRHGIDEDHFYNLLLLGKIISETMIEEMKDD